MTLAQNRIVAKITYPEQKAAVEAYVEKPQNVPKERWQMLKLFQVT
jgi:hypothetical protein